MDTVKVAKFGGSSMRDAARIRQVGEIIKNDPAIRFVVVSAPEGMTDALMKIAVRDERHPAPEEGLDEIISRFFEIGDNLLSGPRPGFDLIDYDRELRGLAGKNAHDKLVSRGECLCAKTVAPYLGPGFVFLDAASFIRSNQDGVYDPSATKAAWATLNLDPGQCYVIPGFYSVDPNGEIRLFSRNASDFSGAVVAACAGASVFEKWTNESGIRRADPSIVPDAELIDELTFREVRELTSRGTKILHPEVIFPLREAGIPIQIKNVDRPEDEGTRVVPNENASPKLPGTVVGISSRKNFTLFGVEKAMMGVGYAAKVLGVFADMNIDVSHIVDGVDEMGIVVSAEEIKGEKKGELFARLKKVCKPDMLNVAEGLAILGVVGHWMDNTPGTAARVFDALGDANISVEIIDQSKSQTNIVIGVADKDCDEAVRAIYDKMIRNRPH